MTLYEWSRKVLFWASLILLILAVCSMGYLSVFYDPRMPDPMCNTDVYFRALIGMGALFGGAVIMALVYHGEIVRRKVAREKREREELKGAIEYGEELRKRKDAKKRMCEPRAG